MPMNVVRALRDRLWCTEVALGEYDVRGVLVVGDNRAVVWDTLSHPRDMTGYLPLIGDRSLTVIYSHADWDHVWGTAGLAYDRAVILGHASCRERFSADVPDTLREKQRAEPGAWDAVVLVPPNLVFEDEAVVDLEPMTLQLRHLPGHTHDSIVGFIPEHGLLLMGDAAETPFPVVPPGSPVAKWVAELERWERDPRVHTVVTAHGPVGGVEILSRNIRYLKALLDGHPLEVSDPLTDFYRTTHTANLRGLGLAPG